jgi:hypothetical protein
MEGEVTRRHHPQQRGTRPPAPIPYAAGPLLHETASGAARGTAPPAAAETERVRTPSTSLNVTVAGAPLMVALAPVWAKPAAP